MIAHCKPAKGLLHVCTGIVQFFAIFSRAQYNIPVTEVSVGNDMWAKFVDSKALIGPSCLRLVGACDCDRCRGRMVGKTAV